MNGKLIAIFLVGAGLLAGVAMYWLQVFAFYEELDPAAVEITIQNDLSTAPSPVSVTNLRAIDSDSSPIRFRACFEVTEPVTGMAYAQAVPLNAPGWFECFDAAGIGADLEAGRAVAVLGHANFIYGVDRVLALYPDGRGVAWHQINPCGEAHFDGDPLPADCPAPPERPN